MKQIGNYMNKKLKTSTIICAAAIMMTGFMGCSEYAQQYTQTQGDPATLTTNTSPYAGVYYATSHMTNSTGGSWITPSNGVSSCTFQDASGFQPPFTWSVVVIRHIDGVKWCTNNNNSLTFPVTNSTSYQITEYVNSAPPPPTNGQPLMLQAQWQ